jgi:hypothetical protein
MEDNFFQGSIPSSFSSLRGIQFLDLSCNNLSGQLPNFLVTIPFISLNLSYNNFEGEVPRKGVFTNESAVSVVGNDEFWNCICLNVPTKSQRRQKCLICNIYWQSQYLVLLLESSLSHLSCFAGSKRKKRSTLLILNRVISSNLLRKAL